MNCQKLKILLAMTIDADTNNDSGVSQGSVSRSYVGKSPSVYLCFERRLRSALRAPVYHSDGSEANVQASHNAAYKAIRSRPLPESLPDDGRRFTQPLHPITKQAGGIH
jgi:hypothetical protein